MLWHDIYNHLRFYICIWSAIYNHSCMDIYFTFHDFHDNLSAYCGCIGVINEVFKILHVVYYMVIGHFMPFTLGNSEILNFRRFYYHRVSGFDV